MLVMSRDLASPCVKCEQNKSTAFWKTKYAHSALVIENVGDERLHNFSKSRVDTRRPELRAARKLSSASVEMASSTIMSSVEVLDSIGQFDRIASSASVE